MGMHWCLSLFDPVGKSCCFFCLNAHWDAQEMPTHEEAVVTLLTPLLEIPSLCSIKAPTHRPDSNQQPTAFIRPLCCLLSDLFGRKVALNTPLRRAASSTVACTFCAFASCNKWVARVYKKRRRMRGLCMQSHVSLYFRSKWNLSTTKQTQINSPL